MDLPHTNTVKPADERPARRDGTCFYCHEKIGALHKSDCVIVSKTVVIRVEMEVVVGVPRDFDPHMVEFRYNESSYCTDNLLRDLGKWAAQKRDDRCSCSTVHAFFQRDAAERDHETLPVLASLENPAAE